MYTAIKKPHTQSYKFNSLNADAYYQRLVEDIEPLKAELLAHPIYTQLNDLSSLRVFMQSHIFAVWDFMTLIKTLQYRQTCINTPWLPPIDINAARLINEIVLAEETDEIVEGLYMSHFQFYLTAMNEVGTDCRPIQNFINSLHQGATPEQSLALLSIPLATKTFVLNTLKTTHGLTHELAAAFFLGREDIIPTMFRQILTRLESIQGLSCKAFQLYLNRHIHLDEKDHAGQKLLKSLCGQDPDKWEQARLAAIQALEARQELWNGILQMIAL